MKHLFIFIALIFSSNSFSWGDTTNFVIIDGQIHFYKYRIDFTTFTGWTYFCLNDNEKNDVLNDKERMVDRITGNPRQIKVTTFTITNDEIALATSTKFNSYQDAWKLMNDPSAIKQKIVPLAEQLRTIQNAEATSGISYDEEKTKIETLIGLFKKFYTSLSSQ